MRRQKRVEVILFVVSVIFISLVLSACSTVSYKEIYPILADGKYDSEFPYKGASYELREISSSVHRIQSSVFYKTYTFEESANFTLDSLKNKNLSSVAISEGYADQSNSGTGTIIYFNEGKVGILTCAHIVEFPDTIISYFPDAEGTFTKYIQVVFIKERQSIYAAGFPEGSQFELLVSDKKSDIALIGKDYLALTDLKFQVFNYPMGKAKELDWGSFVYIFGFPINYQMVTNQLSDGYQSHSKQSGQR